MKRLHVHVAVDNLADSIRFYSGMFGTEPSVVKPDYAKWMLEDPRVNFAISQRGAQAGLDHIGIQVESADELSEMQARLQVLQPDVVKEEGASCCYTKSDKYWLTDPSGLRWETFHTLDSIPVYGEPKPAVAEKGNCCAPLVESKTQSSCCSPKSQKAKTGACC